MNVPLVLFLSKMQQQQKVFYVAQFIRHSLTSGVMLSNNEQGLYIILIIEETYPCSSHSPAPLKHCPNSVLIPRLTLRDNTRLSHTFIVSHPKSICKVKNEKNGKRAGTAFLEGITDASGNWDPLDRKMVRSSLLTSSCCPLLPHQPIHGCGAATSQLRHPFFLVYIRGS